MVASVFFAQTYTHKTRPSILVHWLRANIQFSDARLFFMQVNDKQYVLLFK